MSPFQNIDNKADYQKKTNVEQLCLTLNSADVG